MKRILVLIALAVVAGCREDEPLPLPVALTAESVGHYCQMELLEHPGPKGQVHLEGMPDPLFFSQVRDAIAYLRMPEQGGIIRALYVNDMGRAESWDDPGAENWVLASEAVYVVGADVTGGMGAPEIVPFADPAKAAEFAALHGGAVMAMDAISNDAVFAPVGATVDGGADDYSERLRALTDGGEG
jgi:copper chaperone NosL